MSLFYRVLIVLFCFMAAGNSQAQQKTRILFIFDASNSMNGKWEGRSKIERAREILCASIDDLMGVENLEIALRVYGHQSPVTATYQDCNDTKLEVPFGPNNHAEIKHFINHVQPKGTTPIANSLEAAYDDFPDNTTRNVIILITDGLEACDAFPCEVAAKLKSKGIGVTPFVVGLGMDLSYLDDFECIGRYYEASTPEAFATAMKSVIADAVLNTTVQIDLMDIDGNPTETNTTVFLYEAGTNNLKYTFMHTLNIKGNPDTITIIDPDINYDVVANTLPLVEIKNFDVKKGIHNHIILNTPQGMLQTRIKGPTKTNDVTVRVTQAGKSITLNAQKTGEFQKYIVGTYDVEVFTLPRIYFNDVKIDQSSHTYLDIPGSGQLKWKAYKPIVGQIFVFKDDGTLEWVCDLNYDKTSDIKYLQPGEYQVVYRLKDTYSVNYTNTKNFKIISGQDTGINL